MIASGKINFRQNLINAIKHITYSLNLIILKNNQKNKQKKKIEKIKRPNSVFWCAHREFSVKSCRWQVLASGRLLPS